MSPLATSGRASSACRNARLVVTPRDLECGQRIAHARQRLRAIFRPDNELREQRIVVGRDRIAGAKPRIHAHPFARRRAPLPGCVPAAGRKPLVRILGIQTRLDRVAACPDRILRKRHRAGSDSQLPLHQIEP